MQHELTVKSNLSHRHVTMPMFLHTDIITADWFGADM